MTENEAIKELSYDNTAYGGKCTEEVRRVAIHALSEIQQYRAIGNIEEFKALKEKNEPYKPIVYEDKYYGCKCGEVLLEKWEKYPKKLMPKSWGLPYCLGCGQKLDWQ